MLKTAQLVTIKEAIRSRDGYVCKKCGVTSTEYKRVTGRLLEIHRIVPGSEYSVSDGVCLTVCKKCHTRIHHKTPKCNGWIKRCYKNPVPVQIQPDSMNRLKKAAKENGMHVRAYLDLVIQTHVEPC